MQGAAKLRKALLSPPGQRVSSSADFSPEFLLLEQQLTGEYALTVHGEP